MTSGVPTVDVSVFAAGGDRFAQRRAGEVIDETFRELGFLVVTGHGVEPAVRESFFDAMRSFFALPLADKEALAIGNSPCHRGYVGLEAEALDGALGGEEGRDRIGSAVAGDLKETLDTGAEHGPDHPEVLAGTPLHGPNQLPDLPGFREARDAYWTAMVEVLRRVHRGLAVALGLDVDHFNDVPGEPMCHLRMVHYPPQERVTPSPGQLGCGAHTDYGSVTILADDGVGGLQVQLRSGVWIDVTIPEGALVVNLGDLMAIWTNDRWTSNPHRVVNPAGVDRYSSPFFVEPPFHHVIEALPGCVPAGERPHHDPVVTGEYLLSRFDGTHDYRTQ